MPTRAEVAELTGHDAAEEKRQEGADARAARLPAGVPGADGRGDSQEPVEEDRHGSREKPTERS